MIEPTKVYRGRGRKWHRKFTNAYACGAPINPDQTEALFTRVPPAEMCKACFPNPNLA